MKREWKEMTLGEAADFTSKPRGLNVKSFEKVPFVPMELVAQGGTYVRDWVWKPGKDINSGNYFEKGDCLMARITPCFENGKQGIARELPADFGYASTELIPFRGRAGLSNKYFLFYFVLESGVRRQITQKMEGATGRQRIPMSVLKHWPIMLPSLPEQKKIAAVLLKIQRAIETQDRMIQSLRDLKKSTMQHLFTHGLRGEKTKMTDFGLIPENWRVELLEECSTVQTGVAKGRKISDHELLELPYLRVANVQDGHLDLTEMKTIRLRQSERSRYSLQDGDVVLTEGGDFDKLGRGFVWEGQIPNCVHQNHVFAVRVDRKLLRPHFLAYLVQSQYGKAYFLKVAHKTTNLACINTTKLKRMPVPIPEKAEQDEIVDGINAVDQQVAGHESQKTALQDLFKTVLNKLMTGELRVAGLDVDVKEVGV